MRNSLVFAPEVLWIHYHTPSWLDGRVQRSQAAIDTRRNPK